MSCVIQIVDKQLTIYIFFFFLSAKSFQLREIIEHLKSDMICFITWTSGKWILYYTKNYRPFSLIKMSCSLCFVEIATDDKWKFYACSFYYFRIFVKIFLCQLWIVMLMCVTVLQFISLEIFLYVKDNLAQSLSLLLSSTKNSVKCLIKLLYFTE